ncbi:hemolysin family protein [Candidatus Omnitrophota bacterium]
MNIYFTLIFVVLLFEGFFSGSETALVSINVIRLRHLMEKGKRQASVAYGLLKRPDKLLATTLVGTNLSVVIASSLATTVCIQIFGEKGPLIATIAMTPIILIFGEIIPKTIFREHANRIAPFIALPLSAFQKILTPAVAVASTISSLIIRLLGIKGSHKNPLLTKEEIRACIKEIADQGVLENGEEEIIQSVFDFTLTKAGDIMTPLHKVVSISRQETKERIKEKSKVHGFSRFPVFDGKTLIGLINIFDIFYNDGEWAERIRPIGKADANLRIDELFSQMQAKKELMTVITKDSKFVGIVTTEDIMEEVLCKIGDQC